MLRPVAQKVKAICRTQTFSTYEFVVKIIERGHVAVFVEEAAVLPISHDY